MRLDTVVDTQAHRAGVVVGEIPRACLDFVVAGDGSNRRQVAWIRESASLFWVSAGKAAQSLSLLNPD